MPTPAAGAASPHCTTALMQHHLQGGERGHEPSATLQGCAHTTALTSPLCTRLSQSHQQLPLFHHTWPGYLEEKRWRAAKECTNGVRGVLRWGREPSAQLGEPAVMVGQTGMPVRAVRTYLVLAVAACTRADALQDQGCQRAPSRQHSFCSCQQHGGEPERQGRVLQSRKWGILGGHRPQRPPRAERGPCRPTGGRNGGKRKRKKAEN